MFSTRSLILAVCLGAALWPGVANAQRRYQPPRPTFSPYHNLFRTDSGLLDPYNAYVQPQRRLNQEFNDLRGTVRRQQGRIDELNEGFQQFDNSLASPTGKGGSFMNFGHYFGQNPGSGSTRNSAARNASANKRRSSTGDRGFSGLGGIGGF